VKQLQITVPSARKNDVKEVLEKYSSDFSSGLVEKDDGSNAQQFTVSIDSDKIDEIAEDLKSIDDIDSGDLSIRVLEQESIIEKGQKTRGSASSLSHEEIYSKAQEEATFTWTQWGLIAVSSAVAAYGLALDNLIAVIGAMMLAPILSPFVSSSVSLVVGDSSIVKDSLVSGGMSIMLSIAVSFIAVLPFSIDTGSALELVVSPGVLGILLSILVGIAAALSFATGYRDQIAGVAVAIAIVPPLASVGIGLKMQNIVLALQAGSVALINILAVLISGSATFRLLGLSPETYYRERQAEKMRYVIPGAFILFAALAAPLLYSSYTDFQEISVQEDIESSAEEYFGEDLLRIRFREDSVNIILIGEHDTESFSREFPDKDFVFRELSESR